jgi:ubiquinone/menaquinone biosynthesis C-methylase UbiE
MISIQPGAKVIDAGCGTGATLELLNSLGYDALGLDLNDVLLARASACGKTLKVSFDDTSLPSGCADAILAECVLNLCQNRKKALLEFHRLLSKNGYLIISDLCLKPGTDRDQKNPNRKRGCAKGAAELNFTLNLLKKIGYFIVSYQDQENALKNLSAALVWRYGLKDGLGRLGLMGADCRFKPGDLTYALIIAQKKSS